MGLFTGANVGVKGAYAFLVLLLAAKLPAEVFAQFGMLYALHGAMATFAVTGLGEVTAGLLKSHRPGLFRQVLFRRMSGLFLITASISLILLTPLIAQISQGTALICAAILAVLLGAVIAFSNLQAGFHRIEEHHAVSLLSSAGVPMGGIIGLLIGVWVSQSLAVIFGLGFLGAAITLAGLIGGGVIYLAPVPRLSKILPYLLQLFPFLAMGIIGWLSGYGMNFVINLKFDLLVVAAFTFLLSVSSIAQLIASSMNMAWSPRFYKLFNEGQAKEAEDKSRHFFSVLAILLGAIGAVVVFVLPWFVHVVGGNLEHYAAYRFELACLLAGYVLGVPGWHGANYYLVSGLRSEYMHLVLWSGGGGLLLWLVCIFFVGSTGIFIGFALNMAIKSISMWWAGRKHWLFKPSWSIVVVASVLVFLPLLFPPQGI